MSDLIDRRAAIDAVTMEGCGMCAECIKDIPAAQPEQKTGKWIDKGLHGDWQYETDGRGRCWRVWECSACNREFHGGNGLWKFCPNCGAKMEGENDI